jgi:ComF family protein
VTQTAKSILRDFFHGLLDLLYPSKCLSCGELGNDIVCAGCLEELITPVPPPYCLRCGQIQPDVSCAKCLAYPVKLIRCRAVGVHEGKLADLIHQLKYRDRPMLGEPLGSVIAEYLRVRSEIMNHLEFDAVVPMPLHRSRQRSRGYNQSECLAVAVGKCLQIPVDRHAVSRIRNTKPQVGKRRSQRLTNLSGAFFAEADRCTGKTFLLVDDVSTTGTTLSECSKALLSAGAEKVYAVTLAAG